MSLNYQVYIKRFRRIILFINLLVSDQILYKSTTFAGEGTERRLLAFIKLNLCFI